jgi:hypothetical protein
MVNQTQITEKHRLKLIDWIIEIEDKFNLYDETIFLTINIIDRYLSVINLPLDKLQLLGISAAFIASKYQEIYAPELRDFVYISGHAFSKHSILSMENNILRILKFNLLIVSPLNFFHRMYFITANGTKELSSKIYDKLYFTGLFIMELSLMDYKILKYSSSVIASSALLIGRKLLGLHPFWPKAILSTQGFKNTSAVNACTKDLLNIIKTSYSSFTGLRKKFSRPNYLNIYSIFSLNLSKMNDKSDKDKSRGTKLKSNDNSNENDI